MKINKEIVDWDNFDTDSLKKETYDKAFWKRFKAAQPINAGDEVQYNHKTLVIYYNNEKERVGLYRRFGLIADEKVKLHKQLTLGWCTSFLILRYIRNSPRNK